MGVLDKLVENNEYPIIFIGSGISRRYLENFPGWEELLEKYWNMIGKEKNFYSYLSTLSHEIKENNPDASQARLNYLTNIAIAQEIEKDFDYLFFQEKLEVSNLTFKDAYQQNISPFRKSIAEHFKDYKVRKGVEDEIELFKALIRKAQIIVTTNYDSFIEDMYADDYDGQLKAYIGSRGFFDQTDGWAELFKIHGSIEDSNSIVITEKDYAKYDRNSILISAKLLTAMVNSPIVFLGYSMTDVNVQNLISEFASQLPNEDSRKSAQRIVVVEWKKGVSELIEEQVWHHSQAFHYSLIETDNFKALYEKLVSINQGLTPYHVRKYHHVIKKLVVDRGKKGNLDAVLLSPQELENIEEKINSGKPIVLALGEKTHIYKMPNLESYLIDYVLNEEKIITDVALRFVASLQPISRIPFVRYFNGIDLESLDLTPQEREKIRQRVEKHGKLSEIINSINRYSQINYTDIDEIKSANYKKSKEIDVVVYNINNISNTSQLDEYVKENIVDLFASASGTLKSSLRRLAAAYDLKVNGDIQNRTLAPNPHGDGLPLTSPVI